MPRRALRAALGLLCALVILGSTAPAALAGGPAGGQYKLRFPSSGPFSKHGGRIGSDDSSSVPVALLAGAAAASGVAGIGYAWRRRRSSEAAT